MHINLVSKHKNVVSIQAVKKAGTDSSSEGNPRKDEIMSVAFMRRHTELAL